MKRFILLSFVFLGLGFYELSGGATFDPESARSARIEARQERDAIRLAQLPVTLPDHSLPAIVGTQATQVEAKQGEVTRAALNLVSFKAATQPANEEKPDRAASETPVEETGGIAELAAAEELSLAALDTAPENANSIAFAGNTISATSGDAGFPSDIRAVKGSLVNLRSGPGTDYDIVDQLVQSTQVEVLTDSGNGWVELRPVEGGPTGWIAEFLLTGG